MEVIKLGEQLNIEGMAEDMGLDFENDTKIREDALDVEWLRQPELAVKYGKLYVTVKAYLDSLDLERKILKSDLHRRATADPVECCGKAKPTANDIEAFVESSSDYKEIRRTIVDHTRAVNIVEVMKNEITYTRKATLENLVILFGARYFAGPNVPRDLTEEARSMRVQDDTNTKIAENLGKRASRTRGI